MIQKSAYILAKSYWQEKEREEAENGSETTHSGQRKDNVKEWNWSSDQDHDTTDSEKEQSFIDQFE